MGKFKILIVDDEEDFVDTMVKRLRAKGLHAEGVYRGKDAIRMLDEQEFDVCVLDLRMPGMDGLETLREMKKKQPQLEVIVLTGHGSPDSGVLGLQLGAYNYVMKPVPFDELFEQMEQAYTRKQVEAQRAARTE